MKLPQILAVSFWLCFAAMIAFETLYFRPWMNSSEYFFLTAFLLSALALGWVLADARKHELDLPMTLNVAIVAAAFLAVPYYRFRYFGARKGIVFLGIAGLGLAGLFGFAYTLDYLIATSSTA